MFSRKLLLLSLGLASVAVVWSGVILFTERTRTMEGTWVDLVEESRFFEGKTLSQSCGPRFDNAPWFEYLPFAETWTGISPKTYEAKLVAENRNSGQFISKYGTWPVAAYSIKFIGHKNVSKNLGLGWLWAFGYGHMSAFGSEVQVDRVIAIKPIPDVICDVRSP